MEVTEMRIGRMLKDLASLMVLAKMARAIDTEDAMLLARRLRWIETEDESVVEDLPLAA